MTSLLSVYIHVCVMLLSPETVHFRAVVTTEY